MPEKSANRKRLAIIAGDGIGPEIIAQGRKALETIEKQLPLSLDIVDFPYGAEYYLEHKIVLPNDFIDELRARYDAMLIGTLGDKRVSGNFHVREIVYRLRYGLDLFLGVNQVQVYDEFYYPLKKITDKPLDVLLLREILESTQPRPGGSIYDGTKDEILSEVFVERAQNIRRFIQAALKLAQEYKRDKIVLAHKSNLFPHSYALWAQIMNEECQAYGLSYEPLHADVIILELLQNPEKFECLIAPGIFGETIYTTLLFLQGGVGFAHLCELNPARFGVFRVTQGSAPNLVGRGFANPLGVFIILRELFRYWGITEIATAIEKALRVLLNKHIVTMDLGGMMPTEEVGNYFTEFLSEELDRLDSAQLARTLNQP